MSKEERHKKLQALGWTYSSYWDYSHRGQAFFEVWIRGTESALYFFETKLFHIPGPGGGSEYRISELADVESCADKENGDEQIAVTSVSWRVWPDLIGKGRRYQRMRYADYDVVGFTYYQQPRAAVTREALTLHFDEAMGHVEKLVEGDRHPERLRIIAEAAEYVFFGEPGKGDKLEQEYGVTS